MVVQASYRPRRRMSVLQALALAFALATCLKVWLPEGRLSEPARAQLPNPAADRQALLRTGERTNELLTDIKRILESQTLHVTLERADNQPDSEGPARRGGS